MDSIQSDGFIVGVDPSRGSLHAARWAARRASAAHRPLHLLAARSPESGEGWDHDHSSHKSVRELHQDMLAVLRTELLGQFPELTITATSTDRLPADALVRAATHSRMVVLGSHGDSLLRWSLGSTAHQVAIHAPCSVAVVRADRDPAVNKILVGVDDPGSLAPVEWAAHDALASDSEVLALHVEHTSGSSITAAAHHLEKLVQAVSDRYPDVKMRLEVAPGYPARTLLHEAQQHNLVVVAARGAGGFTALTLGHVAGALLQRADCSVVIVR